MCRHEEWAVREAWEGRCLADWRCDLAWAVFKLDVFDALETWFAPLKHTSLKTTLQNATQVENETSLEVLNTICPPQEPTCVGIVLTRSGVKWLILNYSHCTRNMYHIIHAQVWYEFCISFLSFWIDVLELKQSFNWRVEIWEPFKIKLMWELQSWPLGRKTKHRRGRGRGGA